MKTYLFEVCKGAPSLKTLESKSNLSSEGLTESRTKLDCLGSSYKIQVKAPTYIPVVQVGMSQMKMNCHDLCRVM